jgi:hypothetical protein
VDWVSTVPPQESPFHFILFGGKMKVAFCIPTLGRITYATHTSLLGTYKVFDKAGVEWDEIMAIGSTYIDDARNYLVSKFLESDCTDLFFIDDDLGFSPDSVLKIIKRSEGIVGGVYRHKVSDEIKYMGNLIVNDEGTPYGRDGLIEATHLPMGFTRIKRGVLEQMILSHPELYYNDYGIERYNLFGHIQENGHYYGEDYSFCIRARRLGITVWIEPDITFNHFGNKDYEGNFHEFLLSRIGGK